MSSNADLDLMVATLKVVSEVFSQRYDEARGEIAASMNRGDRRVARSPLDGSPKIGTVTFSDPKPVAQINDMPAFLAWVQEHYPERITRDFEIIGSHQEIAAVLFESAPHLLRPVVTVDPELVKQVRTESAKLGVPIGPAGEADIDGVVVDTPAAVVSCRPDENALAAVVDLFRTNRMSLESLTFPQLPGAEA